MNEKLRQKIIFAALGLAIVWAWFNIGGQKKSSVANENRYETIQPLTPTTAGVASANSQPVQFDPSTLAAADWGADPFRTTYKQTTRTRRSTAVLSWKLTGIMYSQNQPLAYINHKMVKIGDQVDNARVVSINRDQVTLEHNNRTITLKVSRG